MLKIEVEVNIPFAGLKQLIEAKTEALTGDIAKAGAVRAAYNAPYDTGVLSESVGAEPLADDPTGWGVYARTPYALIQELQQPYLYSSVLEVMHGSRFRRIVRKHRLPKVKLPKGTRRSHGRRALRAISKQVRANQKAYRESNPDLFKARRRKRDN